MLSDKALKSFKEIYRKEFNEEISDSEALKLGINLLNLYDHIYRPIKKEWLDKFLQNKDSK